MKYLILINKETNKALQPLVTDALYSDRFWRTIKDVDEADLISVCRQDGCDYEEVTKWIEEQKLEQKFYIK